jgi:hypothetical protein
MGAAQRQSPKEFPRIVNTIDLWHHIKNANYISSSEKFGLQLMILLCARPSDIAGLTPQQVHVQGDFISVARFGTKADRKKTGTPILIPITRSVFKPSVTVLRSIDFSNIGSLMLRVLANCFVGMDLPVSIIRKSGACMLRQRGLGNQDICEVGGWRSEDTLRRFYSRANTDWIHSHRKLPVESYSAKEWPEMLLAQ